MGIQQYPIAGGGYTPIGWKPGGNSSPPTTGTFIDSTWQRPQSNSSNVIRSTPDQQYQAWGGGLGQQQAQPQFGSGLGQNGDFWSQVGSMYQGLMGGRPGNINLQNNLPAMDTQDFNHLLDYTGGSIYGMNYNGGVSQQQQQMLQQKLAAAKANGFRGSIPATNNAATLGMGNWNRSQPQSYSPGYSGFGPTGPTGPQAPVGNAPPMQGAMGGRPYGGLGQQAPTPMGYNNGRPYYGYTNQGNWLDSNGKYGKGTQYQYDPVYAY